MKNIINVFISDVHLGTRFSKTEILLNFLNQLKKEKKLIKIYIIGDFFDLWKLKRKYYWDNYHTEVIKTLSYFLKNDIKIVYIIGNHDDLFRSFCKSDFGNLKISNEEIHVTKDGKRILLIHGDQFDFTTKYNKSIVYIACLLYDIILWIDLLLNSIFCKFTLKSINISKFVKHKVKKIVNYLSVFEKSISKYALDKNANGVMCGHIHHPEILKINVDKHHIIEYYNTGDWVENCSAILEYENGKIEIWRYDEFKKGRYANFIVNKTMVRKD